MAVLEWEPDSQAFVQPKHASDVERDNSCGEVEEFEESASEVVEVIQNYSKSRQSLKEQKKLMEFWVNFKESRGLDLKISLNA